MILPPHCCFLLPNVLFCYSAIVSSYIAPPKSAQLCISDAAHSRKLIQTHQTIHRSCIVVNPNIDRNSAVRDWFSASFFTNWSALQCLPIVFVLRRYLSFRDTQPAPVIQNSVDEAPSHVQFNLESSPSDDDGLCYPLAATAMACESFCMEEMDVRSRSEATASRSREAGLMMHYLGRDDINKRRRSFGVIATIFIDSWSEGNHLFK
jgi:hypothetical protein